MTLSTVQKAALLRKCQKRDEQLQEMENIIQESKKEKRSLTDAENQKLDKLEREIQQLDDELQKYGTTAEQLEQQIEDREQRYQSAMTKSGEPKKAAVEVRSVNPLEVRSFKKGERIGKGSNNVTLGDIIVAHATGKFRNEEVRQLLTTNSGGVTISDEVYAEFIDLMRNQSFLGEFTTYPMTSKTLTIPRVNGDVVPAFKLESDPIPLSVPLFVGATLNARFLYCLTEISLELLESSTIDIGNAVNDIMARSMMASIQNYALAGAVNGYTGILNDPAINTVTGDVSYATIGAAIQEVQAVNGAATSLVINPTDMMGLRLLTETGGSFINPPSFMDDLNIITTNSIAAGQALVGDLSTVAMGILSQNGLQLDMSKDAGFERGMVNVRARFSGDVILTDPNKLTLISAV
jgi:HK97 family phage major capsid protein